MVWLIGSWCGATSVTSAGFVRLLGAFFMVALCAALSA